MAAEQGSAWPNSKNDYELRDVIGEKLYIYDRVKFPSFRVIILSVRMLFILRMTIDTATGSLGRLKYHTAG